jgi:hypothetical protein
VAYNDFSLEALKEQFGLKTDEQGDYFARTPPAPVSEKLSQHLREYVSLAIAIGTEKARSELVIAPVLLEVREQFAHGVSFFSGVEFNPDPERGLRGVCDYLFSLSAEQLTIEAPVVTIVEAKNENLRQGINQCVAEMVAAQVFNRARGNAIETVYGAVTTGTNWLFLRLTGSVVSMDRSEYYISQAEKIVGILVAMLREASAQVALGMGEATG